ncbi:exodeoxyribonuclease III [Parvularcula dongshanensis]|uniref:Exodeoxyribonuclease-3 n=1 Tax=Parvularcula dongshanensis TaxID=1173995 RepID=A0A840HZS6_9PROT|nr:exodeoxyribonuclease III [Parvularcula dongshanensis]MBB4658079.1 exodeoxyribonuclease-3 [Parvularcula dongshanensis]
MRIATWNINSVRLRIDQVTRFLTEEAPDVLCLQEIKCTNDQFPRKAFERAGYPHMAVHGQKGYHGVATVSRAPLVEVGPRQFCGKDDCRHIATEHDGFELHNFYVPAGGDVPDPDVNEKFAHKLSFLEEMTQMLAEMAGRPAVIVGDLNVAPHEHDVWSHKQLRGVVSHTPVETEAMLAMIEGAGLCDVARRLVPMEEKLYTWWSYRAKDWEASNRGRRLDHVWVTAPLEERALAGGRGSFRVHRQARSWEKPSDHAPLTLDL